jgi:hypothetical protein
MELPPVTNFDFGHLHKSETVERLLLPVVFFFVEESWREMGHRSKSRRSIINFFESSRKLLRDSSLF